MKSYHKTLSNEREKSLRRSTSLRPRTPYLFITQEYIKNGPFYIEFLAYMGTSLTRLIPKLGYYSSFIYLQIRSLKCPSSISTNYMVIYKDDSASQRTDVSCGKLLAAHFEQHWHRTLGLNTPPHLSHVRPRA